jgi:hypothetical protein
MNRGRRPPFAAPRRRPAERARALIAFATWVACGPLAACSAVEDVLDPVHAQQVSDLGSDPSGQPNGPTHRPGQPCLVCHGGLGPGSPDLSVGGTVYRTMATREALAGATVTLTDAQGGTRQLTTNQTGNFLVEASNWQPAYPMRVAISYGGLDVDMKTTVGRDGSCAACHSDPPGPASAGHVYLVVDPATFPGGP